MYRKLYLSKDDIHIGNLVLINHDYPIANQNYQSKLVTLNIDYNFVKLDYNLREALINILDELESDKRIIATSGYRSEYEQRTLYENSIVDNGLAFTKAYVAKVNHSEHQSGLAIDLAVNTNDIDLIRPSFPNSGISKAFKEICINFGLIERYKHDKQHLTKINAEEWHFRYIGIPHAKVMSDLNYCLEEYIEYIKQFKRSINPLIIDNYEVSYLPYSDNLHLNLSENETYSGNNVDGFIFTKKLK